MNLSSATALMETADRARALQKERDAALVEAAGCVCRDLAGFDFDLVLRHDPRCPIARAAEIRGLA